MKVLDESGKSVDWWFIYKLPPEASTSDGKKPTKPTTGLEYFYVDANSKLGSTPQVTLSANTLDGANSALARTLSQLFGSNVSSTVGFVCYNDEPPNRAANSTLGHTKGVLAFDTKDNTAFWLLHSAPKFALTTGANFPTSNPLPKSTGPGPRDHGQTFLCVSMSLDTLRHIATPMRTVQEPNVYNSKIPADLPAGDSLRALTGKITANDPANSLILPFTSSDHADFRVYARNPKEDVDLWTGLIGPNLKLNLEVETWKGKGSRFGGADTNATDHVDDTTIINLKPIGIDLAWVSTKDHSKFATSEDRTNPWVVIADINRDQTQAHRGGGGIAFQHLGLWQILYSIQKSTTVPGRNSKRPPSPPKRTVRRTSVTKSKRKRA